MAVKLTHWILPVGNPLPAAALEPRTDPRSVYLPHLHSAHSVEGAIGGDTDAILRVDSPRFHAMFTACQVESSLMKTRRSSDGTRV